MTLLSRGEGSGAVSAGIVSSGSARSAVGAFALGILAVGSLVGCSRDPVPPGVVLVVLDTVRADHVSAYGYERETTPNLDRIAGEGELYREAYAQAPWTLPAVATILTGQPPRTHGAGLGPEAFYPVRSGVMNLAERLAPLGFRTAAFMNVAFCSPDSGMARGFETYDYRADHGPGVSPRDAAATVEAALSWMATVSRAEAFFMTVHFFDPHLPYAAPPPYAGAFTAAGAEPLDPMFGTGEELFAIRRGARVVSPGERLTLVSRYDDEIRFVDEQLGRLREGLERMERWDASLVIVVADHGEEFWDHGSFEHGHSHFREILRVPLVVRRPGGPRGRVSDDRVRQIDIVPTVLTHLGLDTPPDLPGVPLGEGSPGVSIAEGSLWAGDLVSVRADEGTLLLRRDTGDRWLFHPDDPLERLDVAGESTPGLARLERLLEALPEGPGEAEATWQPTPEEREALRALGYLP